MIWQHVSEALLAIADGGEWTRQLADYFDFGRVGVVAFFCISGFVIPASLRGPRSSAIKAFAINRFFRLYPIYWLSIPIGAFAGWFAFNMEFSPGDWAGNIFMVANFFGQTHILGHYWTLEVELAFYGASALTFAVLPKHCFFGSILGFLFSYQLWRRGLLEGFPGSTPQLGQLMMIMFATSTLRCLPSLKAEPCFNRSKWFRFTAYALTAYLAYLTLSPYLSALTKVYTQNMPELKRYGWGHLLGIVLFLAFLYQKRTFRWLAFMGRCSYSAYLFHSVCFTLISQIWIKAELPHTRLEYYIIATTVLSFGVAILTYRYVEVPCIQLGKRLASKL